MSTKNRTYYDELIETYEDNLKSYKHVLNRWRLANYTEFERVIFIHDLSKHVNYYFSHITKEVQQTLKTVVLNTQNDAAPASLALNLIELCLYDLALEIEDTEADARVRSYLQNVFDLTLDKTLIQARGKYYAHLADAIHFLVICLEYAMASAKP